jgi:hypothetical protein
MFQFLKRIINGGKVQEYAEIKLFLSQCLERYKANSCDSVFELKSQSGQTIQILAQFSQKFVVIDNDKFHCGTIDEISPIIHSLCHDTQM